MKGLQFSFPQSVLATRPAPPVEEDPVIHRLPAEPARATSRHQKHTPKAEYHEESSRQSHDNTALIYSPEMPVSFQPRGLPDTSPFNKRREDATPRKYLVKPYEAQIEVKVVGGAGRSGSRAVSVRSEEPSSRTNRQASSNRPFESIPSEESRAVKPKHSFVKKLNFDLEGQSTTRQEKQSSLIKLNPVRTDQEGVNQEGQVEQLRSKLTEMQNLNASLRMQYQIGREKLGAKEAENHALKESYEKLRGLYEESDRSLQRYIKMEAEFIENKSMMSMFCDEIEQQKELTDTLRGRLQEVEPQLAAAQEINCKWEAELEQVNSEWERRIKEEAEEAEEKRETMLREAEDKWLTKLRESENKWETRLRQETDAYQLLFDTQERDADTLKDTIKALQSRNQQLSHQLSVKTEQIKSLRAKLEQQTTKLQTQLEERQMMLVQAQTEKKQKAEKLAVALPRISVLEYQENEFKRQIEQLSNSIRVSQQIIAVKQQKINNMNRDMQQLRRKFQDQIEKFNAAIQGKQLAIKQLESSKQILQQNLDRSTVEKNVCLIQAAQLKQANSRLFEEIDSLNRQLAVLKGTIKQKQSTIVLKQAKIEELNCKIAELQSTILQLQQDILKLQRKIAELTSQLARKEQQISRLTSLNSDLALENQSKNNKIAELQQRLPNYEKVLASYRDSMQQLKATHEQRWQQLKTFYEEQFAGLQAQLKDFSEAENSKRNFKSFKKRQLSKQTTAITTTSALRPAVLDQSTT